MVDLTESFNKADGPLGPDLTWTDVDTGWSVSSNEAACGGAGSTQYARAEHDTTDSDQYAEAVVTALANDTGEQFGPCVRFQTGVNSSYMFMVEATSVNTWQARIRKTINGTRSDLTTSVTVPGPLPFTVRTEVEGSTIRGYVNGNLLATTTDTDLTSGTRTGIYGAQSGGGDVTRIDSFASGDLGGAVVVLDGSGSVAATANGSAAMARPLAAGGHAGSTASGAAVVARALAGSGTAATTADGNLTVTRPPVTLDATATVATTADGSLSVARPITAGAPVAATATATDLLVSSDNLLDGSAAVACSAAGIITVDRPFAGTATTATTVTGTPNVARGLAGTAVATVTSVGILGREFTLSGEADAAVTVTADLFVAVIPDPPEVLVLSAVPAPATLTAAGDRLGLSAVDERRTLTAQED